MSYTAKDYDIAYDYIVNCISHFGVDNNAKVKSFIEMQYNRGNITFNEYLACIDILKDKENGLWR